MGNSKNIITWLALKNHLKGNCDVIRNRDINVLGEWKQRKYVYLCVREMGTIQLPEAERQQRMSWVLVSAIFSWLVCILKFFTIYFFKIFFLMWTIFKVFIEFVTILLLFYVLLFWLRGMWDLSSPTRDQTRNRCIERRSLNHWTAREVPSQFFKRKI